MADLEATDGASDAPDGLTRLDHASLRSQPAGGSTRYTISLVGDLDAEWMSACKTVQADSTQLRRFQIDAAARTASFSCPNVEGPAMVLEMMDRLEDLLAQSDRLREENRAAASEPPVLVRLRPIA